MKTLDEAVDKVLQKPNNTAGVIVTQNSDDRFAEIIGEVGANVKLIGLVEDYMYFICHDKGFSMGEILSGLIAYGVAIGIEMEKYDQV